MKVGIIGNGRIAERFVAEFREVVRKTSCEVSRDNAESDANQEVELVAVYNPHEGSAEGFAKKQGIPHGTENLAEFLAMVDAVYIAVPHQYHYDYAKQMLQAEKHVLCEKPMCLKRVQAEELFQLAERKHLVLMEAMKTNYCPGFQQILTLVRKGMIGRVVDVEAAFTRIPIVNVREVWDAEYGGSFTEFGTYAMLPIVKLLGTEGLKTQFQSVYGETGVDVYTKANFTKDTEDGTIFGTAKTGLGVKSEGQLLISGTKGYILVPSPWWLMKYFIVCREDPKQNQEYEVVFEGAGLRYEIKTWLKHIHCTENIKTDLSAVKSIETIIVEGNMEMLTPQESIWMAEQMEHFLATRDREEKARDSAGGGNVEALDTSKVGIWAHRGCCFKYPENTIPAFLAAAKIPGLKGIELDIQLTKDGEMVVIHDEKVDATTTSKGAVCEYTLAELQEMKITGRGCDESVDLSTLQLDDLREFDGNLKIPTIREVFEALMPYLKKGLLINIELKNSNVRYEGMEQKIIALVHEMGLEKNIIYSSFLPESMGVIKELDPQAKTGILGGWVHWCTQKMQEFHADAVHPYTGGMDITKGAAKEFSGFPVRAWNMEEPFFGSKTGKFKDDDMLKYAKLGVTDIFTNVPERYLL